MIGAEVYQHSNDQQHGNGSNTRYLDQITHRIIPSNTGRSRSSNHIYHKIFEQTAAGANDPTDSDTVIRSSYIKVKGTRAEKKMMIRGKNGTRVIIKGKPCHRVTTPLIGTLPVC